MDQDNFLISLGALFLAGLVLDAFGRIVHIPRVTLIILLGAFLGPPVLDVLPDQLAGTNDIYAAAALTMVAFLLGASLKRKTFAEHGRQIIFVSIFVVIASLILVSVGLYLAGVPLILALLLGGISTATAPAATRDVIRQSGYMGSFATNILGIVAIDDAWGLLAFSIVMTICGILVGGSGSFMIIDGLWEVGGAVILGVVIGVPTAFLTGRLKPGEPTLMEAIGVVLLCSGLALWLDVSFLLTGMVCGMVVANRARHHERPFNEIERIEWPFVFLFFIMAGASLEVRFLGEVGIVGLIYVVLRMVARILGGWSGGILTGLSHRESALTGLALMPQAGIAIGMALVASNQFPIYKDQILVITLSSTIIFEIIGPICTQYALSREQQQS
jgi:Kef-type K+ transport system membrane component KefB